ncbi:MAG: molybdate ABC transporter substrate-binding protein, partial [bacterium]|nr:molybdate ABC transporter substrate-binding protein [bacterium]
YSSSGILRKKIEAGACVDLILSASTDQLDALDSGGYLSAGTRRRIASNGLVCITGKNAERNITGPEVLMDNSIGLIAVGDPGHVPAGFHAKEALVYYGLWEDLERRLTYAADVRAALAQVETGNADAGIVYASDALTDDEVVIAFYFPKSSYSPIIYEGAVLSNADTPDEAFKFLDYVATSTVVFERNDFEPIPDMEE